NIDLQLYEASATLKYDVIVHPGGNPDNFIVEYNGQDQLYILNGELVITTSLGNIIEGKPKAYQIINGNKKDVDCFYVLEGNRMRFALPNGYDASVDLVIDPDLTFSTFTGATS